MEGGHMSFYNNFTVYDKCAPPGVLLPQITIESKHYKRLGISNTVSNLEFLKKLCWENMKEMGFKRNKANKPYFARMKSELETFEELGFIDYILLNWDILNYCHEQDIPTGPGRGSAAGSLVLFVLKVTKVDPIKYDLFFERFVSKSRAKKIVKDGVVYLDGSLLADVDNDIAYDRRQQVIDYIKHKHEGRTCKILNLVSLSGKLCIKEVGKLVGGHSEEDMNVVSTLIPVKFGKVAKLKEALQESEKFAAWADENELSLVIGRKLEGLIKNTGVHASGIAISHEKLTDICPIQKTKDGELISCYDMNWIAELTVKFDILGLKTLTVINDTLNLLKEMRSIELSTEDIDLQDKFIYQNLQELHGGQGLFQIEADTNYDVCKRVKPRNLEEISAVVAIARPGALEFKDQYASYVRTGEPELVHPHFADILDYTGGIPLYQEQLMKMAVKVGFTLDEAEQLRRIVGKKKIEQMPEWKEKIAQKAEENRLTNAWTGHRGDEIADVLWEVAEDSANYSFNKSHSISYAMIAAWTTYLKFTYPQEFFIALLKMAKNETDPFDQVNKIAMELPRHNIKLLPPDLAKSNMDFSVEEKDIRYGLDSIKGVSEKSKENIINFRSGAHAHKFEMFQVAKDAKVNIGVLASLIQAGALNSFEGDRSRLVLEAQSFNILTDREKRITNELGVKYSYDILILLEKEVMAPVKEKKKSVLMSESRCRTFLSKYEQYKKIYLNNSQHTDFANWYYESKLLGYSYSCRLKNVFSKKTNALLRSCEEVEYINDNALVKYIGVVKDVHSKVSRAGTKYQSITVGDETGRVRGMFFEYKYKSNYLDKGKVFPVKDDILIVAGTKKDGGTVWIDDINIINNYIFMKLSDIK
jgi:DNA polymerase-3 subunit alpha